MRSRSFLLGLPLPLLLAPLVAPLFVATPTGAQIVGPSCCVSEGEAEPGHPHPRIVLPYLVGVNVKSPDERAFKAKAEAPITADAPLLDAVGVPLYPADWERRSVSDPALVPGLRIVEPPPMRVDPNGPAVPATDNPNTPPCCQAPGQDPEEPPPFFTVAKARSPEARALETAAEAPVPADAEAVEAVGLLLNDLPELPEPARAPVFAVDDRVPVGRDDIGLIDLSGCCRAEGETHPPHPHPEKDQPPVLIGAKVKNREKERLLEMAAEAPIPSEAELVKAIGVPLYPADEERRGVSEPAFASGIAGADLIPLPGCCQVEAEGEHPHPDNPPPFVAAKVKNREKERLLAMAAEAQIRTAAQLVQAIGVPLYPADEERRGVSEPASRPAVTARRPAPDDRPDCCGAAGQRDRGNPASVDAPAILAILVAIGLWLLARRRRSRMQPEPPSQPRPLRGLPTRPDAAPIPRPEPEVARARARAQARKLESA